MVVSGSFVRWALGGILLLAAALKGFELASGPLTGAGFWANRWLMAMAVEAEALMGFWLVSGWRPKAALTTGAVVYFLFGLFALEKAFGGASSCGCFGRLPVNPWITFGVDVIAVMMAFVGRLFEPTPASIENPPAPFRIWQFRIPHSAFRIFILLLLAGVFLLITFFPREGRPDLKLVVLDPRSWVGKEWPIGPKVDGWAELARGCWAVLLYSWPCGHCAETIRDYADMARGWENDGSSARVALVDTSGEEPPDEVNDTLSSSPALRSNLRGPANWFIASPTVVVLQDGKVLTIAQGEDECQWDNVSRSLPPEATWSAGPGAKD